MQPLGHANRRKLCSVMEVDYGCSALLDEVAVNWEAQRRYRKMTSGLLCSEK